MNKHNNSFLNEYLGLGVKQTKYEITIYQGGDCIKMKVDASKMSDVMYAALQNDCQVHIKQLKG